MVSEQEIETLSPDHSGSKVAVAPLLHSANETVAELTWAIRFSESATLQPVSSWLRHRSNLGCARSSHFSDQGAGWKDRHASDPTLEWADETARLLRPYSGNRIYCNYQSFEGKGAAEAVFGGTHARLVAIKQKYDPTNFFRRNSNIKPA